MVVTHNTVVTKRVRSKPGANRVVCSYKMFQRVVETNVQNRTLLIQRAEVIDVHNREQSRFREQKLLMITIENTLDSESRRD